MNKSKIIYLSILVIIFISFISASQICQIYDDFSSGNLDTDKWEIRRDVMGFSLTNEYWVDNNLENFHIQQSIIEGQTPNQKHTYIFPKRKFTTGDILEYDVNLISKEGSYIQMVLLTGSQYIRVGIFGWWSNSIQGYNELGVSHIKIEFQENNFHLERTTPSNVTLIDNLALTDTNGEYELYVGGGIGDNGKVHMDFDNFKLCTELSQPTIEERVGFLESWKQIIEDWRIPIINSLAVLTSKVLELTEKINNQEERITALENSSAIEDLTPNYWKYLSANERKNIVCGYAEDNHLTDIEDLGWSCRLTYKNNRWNKEIANCKCKKFK